MFLVYSFFGASLCTRGLQISAVFVLSDRCWLITSKALRYQAFFYHNNFMRSLQLT